jgi:membrane-bound lytic murein transglycosylase MltF
VIGTATLSGPNRRGGTKGLTRRALLVGSLALLVVDCSRQAPTPKPTPASPVPASPLPASPPPESPPPSPPPTLADEGIAALRQPWKGDFDGMVKRRVVRVLTAYSRTGYFLDGASQRGITYETAVALEKTINDRLKTSPATRVQVFVIPVARNELLKGLVEGRGDIAAANLTITHTRRKLVDFSTPALDNVREVVVTAKGVPALAGPEDLSGREVYVRASSSYFTSLKKLQNALQAAGKRPVTILYADERLEDEDILEMVSAGLVPATVVDDHTARFWNEVLSGLEIHPAAAVRTGGQIGMGFRKGSPQLKRLLDDFMKTHRAGTAFGNVLLKKYLQSTDFVRNAGADEEMARFRQTIALFRKYAPRYGFDALMVAAQGYQESRLDQSRRSPRGAVGVMQLLPSTAREMGFPDVEKAETNVHAGVKYLRWLRDHYFSDAPMAEVDKQLFCFASYNAGPGRVVKLRQKAKGLGLNPNRWFSNVEVVAGREIGRETVQYVSNIYKYYVTYRMILERQRGAAAL